MSEKIRPTHLERDAYVYVRQSTMGQVRHNRESRRRQYGLRDRARKLGFREVVVLDEDLGRSGSGSEERPGFAKLVAAVCAAKVGAVLAVEASRLARNNRDWHHLVDLCALTDALVIDHDGIYDPRMLNDRLLLGLKGTMSEFELGMLRQRSQEALRQMIRRGEVLWEVPIGYVRTPDNRCEMTPDRQIQAAIHGVFSKFRELGSVRQVLLWHRDEQILLPATKRGTQGAEVVWKLPIYSTVLAVLKNPVYAGAFVHGRTGTRTVVRDGRAHKTAGHVVPREQWAVLIRDHHPGYIGWDEYLRNQEQLVSNAGMNGRIQAGAAKSGPALLAGLLRCGHCGRKLHVAYGGVGGRVPRYHCRGAHLNHGTEWCISFGGLRVDQAVSAEVLRAVQPMGVTAALEAWEQTSAQEDEKRRALRLAAEKARYEVDHARKQYDLVDPANRLVAAELEKRWDDALERLGEAEQRLKEIDAPRDAVDPDQRDRLLELGSDLGRVWNHPEAPVTLKKRILRTVLVEIIAKVSDDPPLITLTLHWAGGVHTTLRVPKNRTGRHGRSTDRDVVDLLRELAKVCDDTAIAAILNKLGYRTGAGNGWTETRVRGHRQHHKIPASRKERRWLTADAAADQLGISAPSVLRMIRDGVLPATQVVRYAPWVIEKESLSLPAVQEAVRAIQAGRPRPRSGTGHNETLVIPGM